MIHIIEGNVGQGKTYLLSKTMLLILRRNKKWLESKKTKHIRYVVTNMQVSEWVLEHYGEYVKSWTGLEDLVTLRECDVIFDDMSTYLDAQEWANIPMTVKHWLRLHEHYGCDIYGNAQDFNTIYKSVRQLTTSLKRVRKIFGSRRPCVTKPGVDKVFGIMISREVDGAEFEQEKEDRKMTGFPTFHTIKKSVCSLFNTSQDLEAGKYPPLDHIERTCIECAFIKTIHR